MPKSRMPDSEPEYRFIFYTTNLLLLALADLPLLILRWITRASKLLSKTITYKDERGETEMRVTSVWKGSKDVLKSYPLIMEKLASIPAGFSPFTNGMRAHTILKPEDVLEFTSVSIDLKNYPDNPWKEIRKIDNRIARLRNGITKKQEEAAQLQKEKKRPSLKLKAIRKIDNRIARLRNGITKKQEEAAQLQKTLRKLKENDPYDIPSSINKLWDTAELVVKTPKIKSWWPKRRNHRILVLESVKGSKAKARDAEYVWALFDEMIKYGGSLARTPICEVVTFSQENVKRLVIRKAELPQQLQTDLGERDQETRGEPVDTE